MASSSSPHSNSNAGNTGTTGTAAQITTTPRVYYLPDPQGRMAAYYNAMELPGQYTTNHGIPRTNHYIPIGYCCSEELAPRGRSHKGAYPRHDYTQNKPAADKGRDGKTNGRDVVEPRAPPSSPQEYAGGEGPMSAQLISIGESPAKGSKAGVAASASPAKAPVPTPTPPSSHPIIHPHPLPQKPNLPLSLPHPACASPNCTLQPVNAIKRTPATTPPLCRRWLTGTCRRGASCRNRHYVLDESVAELARLREGQVGRMRCFGRVVGVERQESPKLTPELGSADGGVMKEVAGEREEEWVEAFVRGVGMVKIPIGVVRRELGGLELGAKGEEGRDEMAKVVETAILHPSGQHDPEEEQEEEPIPDYSLAMPPTPAPAPLHSKPSPTTHAHPTRPSARNDGYTHPVERLPASHTPLSVYNQTPISTPAHPRRQYPSQDFVPRHVLDRALRQYITSSMRGRGRHFLAPKHPGVSGGARRRAVLAQMQSAEVAVAVTDGEKGKGNGVVGTDVAVVAGKVEEGDSKEDVERRSEGSGEIVSRAVVEKKVEIRGENGKVAPALLVDVGQV